MTELKSFYEGKSILVTGGAGSIGSEIVKKLLEFNPKVVRVLDNNETGLFELGQSLPSDSLRLLVGDIRDKERLKLAMEGINIVFHAAALKHVPLCEYNPFEAVKTNTVGTQNMIDAAITAQIDTFITISTDKAVNPTNVMGATKLLSERLTTAANFYKGARKTRFSAVRFGNVLDTRGSIVPIFRNQIKQDGLVTITDPDMTRFMMSISHSVDLVLSAAAQSAGGEIFILKMPAVRIGDLAEVLIEEFSEDASKIKIKTIGKRPGEKLHEELITPEESTHAKELDNMFVVLPEQANTESAQVLSLTNYTSNNGSLLDKPAIKELLSSI